ncbi:response regulator [Paenibacillus sp. LMG 31456]|uniref:Response regulator n=1 Tax=Paenibacillus foliorum TaxID=2654974 RepID=A0A972GX43_9BACL|nr:response regulator [Paenibacillus foliorum]NOU96134.1 response regulator [Paenibacillus foliorum]
MYKLMIVEDEPLIRAGLKQYFSWQELGVDTICEAENGKDGILVALQERPDLVITDIRMPVMDGLEMIRQLRKELPDTVFIILTGHNDFDYAQKAIGLGGVHAYLLKPMQYEESLSTIQQCIVNLKQKQQEFQNRSNLQREAEESIKLRGSQLVKLLLEEEPALEEETLQQLYGYSSGEYLYQPFLVAYVSHTTSLHQARRWLRDKAERIINEAAELIFNTIVPKHIFTYIYKSKYFAIAVYEVAAIEIENESPNVECQLDDKLKQISLECDASVYLVVGRIGDEISQIGLSLRHAEKDLYRRFVESGSHLFLPQIKDPSFLHNKELAIQLHEKDKNQLLSYFEKGDHSQIKHLMKRLAQETCSTITPSSLDKWLVFLQEIISVTLRFANTKGIHIDGVYSDKLLTLSCVDDFESLEALFDWLSDWMIHLSTIYQETSLQTSQQDVLVFEEIEIYIKQNIDQDMTLQMVADRFFYNPSYLSRLFKKKLNKNYMIFVTEIRISYAQECLKQPHYLVTDVCHMCGYKSYKHFVKTFRSVAGMTPTEYRKKLGL